MSGESFPELGALLASRISKNDTSFTKMIPVEKRVAVRFWRLATENSLECTAIGKSTAAKI